MELQEFDFFFLVEATSRATLADLLTYKDGPILVKEVEEKLAKKKQVTIPGASTLFFYGSYKRSLHQSTGKIEEICCPTDGSLSRECRGARLQRSEKCSLRASRAGLALGRQ